MAVQCTGSIAPGPGRIRDFRHRLLGAAELVDDLVFDGLRIRSNSKLDRDLLTPATMPSRSFGVSKVRGTALMTVFGAGRTGHLLTLPRAEVLRPLRRHRKLAAFRGEEARRQRVVTEALEAHLSSLPEGVSVEPRADRGALQRREGRRRAALRTGLGGDERLRAIRGARRRGNAGMHPTGLRGSRGSGFLPRARGDRAGNPARHLNETTRTNRACSFGAMNRDESHDRPSVTTGAAGRSGRYRQGCATDEATQ